MSDQRDHAQPTGAPSDTTEPAPAAEPALEPAPAEVIDTVPEPAGLRMRRAPRYGPFGATGAALGAVAGIALALSFSAASNYSMQTIAGYFAASLGLLGGLLGLAVAVLVERRHRP